MVAATGCHTVAGTPTWTGATLEKVSLTESDFPDGVRYSRIEDKPGQPDGAGEAPSMMTRPEGCSNGLTKVIAASAERGPGSALKYQVDYNGARIAMTVLSFHLDLEALAATAQRCEHFTVLFDPTSAGIPMTTTAIPADHDQELLYRQTMTLDGGEENIYMGFANIGSMGLFGVVFPHSDPKINVKAALPQTFLEVFARQADRIRGSG